MPKTKLTARTIAATNKWTTVVEEKFSFDDGRQGEYLIVERPPAICMLPLLHQDNKYYTYLVQQYRYPIDQWVWQFPMGSLDKGKDMLEHAKDELHQETGLIANKVTLMRDYFMDPGLSRQHSVFYVGEGITEGGKQELDEEEKGLTYKKILVDDLEGMIADGSITDFWGYIGIRLLQDYRRSL